MLPERTLTRTLSVAQADELIGSKVPARDVTLTDSGVYHDAETGEPALAYGPWPGDRESLQRYRWALLNVPDDSTVLRAAGVRNRARTFGYAPRNVVLKRESCRPSGMAFAAPEPHAIISSEATRFHHWLKDLLPQVVEDGWRTEIDKDWRLTDEAYWTSGVVNITSVLPYHRDRNNFPVWSVMPVVRRGVRGGRLHLAEYDQVIECRDGWLVAFPGQALVHGVTPMTNRKPDGYRISAVYYCLRGMKNCAADAIEQGEALQRRTERERQMGDPEHMTVEAAAQRITGRTTGGTVSRGLDNPGKYGRRHE